MRPFRRLTLAAAASCLIAGPAMAQSAETAPAAAPAVTPKKVYAIVNVVLKPGQDAAYVAWMKQDAVLLAKVGLRLVASYAIQFGVGNRHVQIWEADSAETIRRAGFELVEYPASILDIIEREDIEIAVQDQVEIAPDAK